MTENLKKFLEAVSKDEALQAKVNALESNKETAMADIIALAKELNFTIRNLTFSPVKGPEGNIEFLAEIRHDPERFPPVTPETVSRTVEESHHMLDRHGTVQEEGKEE